MRAYFTKVFVEQLKFFPYLVQLFLNLIFVGLGQLICFFQCQVFINNLLNIVIHRYNQIVIINASMLLLVRGRFALFVRSFRNKWSKLYFQYICTQYNMDPPKGEQMLELDSHIRNGMQASKQPSLPDLSNASKKMSEMNILIVQKISIIVAEYFDSIEKLQTSYKQIAVLIEYNKRLIEVLNEFEEQQTKLLTRLNRMQQINFEYMKEYCQVKGREFKMPSLPEHKSIFQKINLQDLAYVQQEHQAKIIDLNYKQELMDILENCFLTNQNELASKIQAQLQSQIDEWDKRALSDIKELICDYNSAISNKRQQNLFDLLRMRSEIRRRVEQYYDRSKETEVKPDYEQEDKFINKVINLHARLQEMNKDAILHYLSEQKQTRSTIEKSRVEIQSTFQKKYDQLQAKSRMQGQQISQLKESNISMQKHLRELQVGKQKQIMNLNKQIGDIKAQIDAKNEEIAEISFRQRQNKQLMGKLEQLNKQLSLQITLLSTKKQVLENQMQTQNPQLVQTTWDILTIDPVADNSALQKLQTYIKALQQQLETCQLALQQKDRKIAHFSNQVDQKVLQVETFHQKYNNELKLITTQLSLARQENQKYEADKLLVENLANKVCQAINLISSMELNKPVKQRLSQISKKLQFFLAQYQKDIEWNIEKQAPGYFHEFSMMTNLNEDAVSPSEERNANLAEKRGYSFQINNVNLIKEILNADLKREPQKRQVKSQMHERPQQFDEPIALDLSNQADDKNLQEQFENLRKAYQQCLECLAMEEKKSLALQLEYQKFVQAVYEKQKLDPEKYSLQKQIVYLTKLSIEQKETIETERKEYNQIFRDFHSQFKSKAASQIKSLRAQSFDVGHKQNKQFF